MGEEWKVQLEDNEEEIFTASTLRFLLDGGEIEPAKALLSSEVSIQKWMREGGDNFYGTYGIETGHYDIEIRVPRLLYDTLSNKNNPNRIALARAFTAILDSADISIKPMLVNNLSQDWKNQFQQEISGNKTSNQGQNTTNSKYAVQWNGLLFASQSEARIAQALDKQGVLYFANCMARLGLVSKRENKEPDFLIFHEGKYGILEVDGQPFHQSAAKDHTRDRLFKEHGIMFIEHYTAEECYNTPDSTVGKFLALLKKS